MQLIQCLTIFFEERGCYGALRNKFVKCYDGVPQADIIARSKILKYINKFGQRALAAVDDPDDYEEQYAVVDLAKYGDCIIFRSMPQNCLIYVNKMIEKQSKVH